MVLFSPVSLGDLHLPNRVVMAPLTRMRSGASGVPGDIVAEHYAQRASVGLIITEGTYPSHESRAYPGQPGIVTAEQVGSYKPSEANFQALFDRLGADGVPRDRILHVAQSRYHDHAPAKRLGMTTVWIDRRHDRAGAGATPVADAEPDATYPSMAAFAEDAVPA